MVNENNNINQYVDKKPFELVQEVNNEVPSFEEFMKTYQEDGKATDSYNSEFDSYGDIRIIRPYGPGFWDDFLRPVTSAALAISYATPFAVVTVPVSVGVGVTGAAMATFSDDSDARNVGCQMLGVVGEATISHVSGGNVEGASKTKLIVDHVRRNI